MRKYNFLYKKIVQGERDVVGHIAYALYKDAKIKYIENYKAKNNGDEPTEDSLEYFHSISCLDEEVERYRLQATAILQDFSQNTLEETKKKMDKENADLIKKIKPRSFMYGVSQSIVGALLFMILIAAIIFGVTFSQKDYVITLGHGNAMIEEAGTHHPDTTSAKIAIP